jgi:hypothetical protein
MPAIDDGRARGAPLPDRRGIWAVAAIRHASEAPETERVEEEEAATQGARQADASDSFNSSLMGHASHSNAESPMRDPLLNDAK